MNAYFDTSVIASAYCDEPDSAKAQKALQDFYPVISSLTRIEFSSAVSKKYRMQTYTKQEACRVISQFHLHINQSYFKMTPVKEVHYEQADEWMSSLQTGLRTIDALHLAIAHANQLTLITADVVLGKAARTFGVSVKVI